jgi:hypothetical protein
MSEEVLKVFHDSLIKKYNESVIKARRLSERCRRGERNEINVNAQFAIAVTLLEIINSARITLDMKEFDTVDLTEI